jgi:hypothetical protein
MASLQEIRQQYPQYKDVPDRELADALYKKFYEGKIDKSAFDQKMGFGVGQEQAPQQLQAPQQQPANLVEAMQNPAYQEQGRLAAGMRSFVNEATLGLGRDVIAAGRAAPALFTGSKDFLPEYERQAAFEKAQLAGGEKEYGTTTALSGLAGGVATSIALTPARVAGWINKSAPFLERAAKYALVSAPVEAFRATQNLQEDETVPQAVGRGLETAAIAGPLGAALEKGVGAVTNVGRVLVGGAKKGPITEAEKVIQAGKEANIPIRTTDVYPPQSWAGKKLQQVTDRIPIAGTGGNLVKTQAARQKSVEDFVKQYVSGAQNDPAWLREINEQVKSKSKAKLKRFQKLKSSVLDEPDYNTDPNVFKQQKQLNNNVLEYRKDIAKLEDQLSNGQSRKYVDLLQEELDPSYQASLQGVNIDNFEEFKYLLDGANQKMPSVKQPTTLLTRIRQLGGIKSTDYNKSDIKAMDINVRGKTKRSISSEGTLQVTNKPKSLDYMRESLVEEGWLKPNATINDLLDAMNVDEMARNTGIGHIYSPKDASKGLEYENSLQYVSGASEARDKLYFDYGIEDPKAFKESIDKGIAKAKKQLEKLGTQESFDSTMDFNTLNKNLLKKREQLNLSLNQMERLKSKEKSVPVPAVTAKIDELLGEWNRLASGGDEEAKRIVDILNKEKTVFNKNDGLGYLEKKRELLSAKYSDDPTVKDVANKIYDPLNQDIGNFLKSKNPFDYKKWKSGNEGLTILGDETKSTALSRVINKGNVVPEAAKGMILSQKPSEVANIGRYLNKKGKDNAKKIIIEDLISRSKIDGGETIDPDKFLKIASQRNSQFKTFFSTQEQDALKGLEVALRATKDAERFSKSTPWLQTAALSGIPILGVFVGTGSAKVAAGAAAGAGLAGRAYQSKAMRNTLVALGRVKQNSTAERRLIDKLISLQAGQATAREITGE